MPPPKAIGDIVKVYKLTFDSSRPLPAIFNVQYYGGMFELFRGLDECLMGLHLLYIEIGEIIGTVHENPELLEENAELEG